VFELTPSHAEQLGAFLGRAHLCLRKHRGGRKNPYGLPVMLRWLADIDARSDEPDLVAWLRDRMRWVARDRRPLPRGVIHGDLFMNNTKWRQGELFAVFDWEMAGPDHLALDLGICLNAWCFKRDAREFDEELCAALLRGYRGVRELRPSELRGLYRETVLGALRFTLSRIRDFHLAGGEPAGATPVDIATPADERAVAPAEEPVRDFLDYREYRDRVEALWSMGARTFQEAMLG
jgi:homoserine kinase type II